MPIFEIEGPNGIYEVDAPDEERAVGAFKKMQGLTAAPKSLPAEDGLSELRTATGGFLEGIPVIGPAIRGGVERAAAATIAPFSDLDYGKVLETIQKGTADEKAANPILDTGAQIAGGVAGTVPMIMAAPSAFGLGAGNAYARLAASSGSGLVLGAADSAVRSGADADQTMRGAAMGGSLGLLGPIAGSAIGKGASYLMNRVRPTATTVQRLVGEAAQADAITDPVAALAAKGPNAMVMDLGPNLQQTAGALASLPGESQQIVRSAVTSRDIGANTRIRGAVDDTLGPAPTPSRIEAEIAQGQASTGPLYDEALKMAAPVDATAIANNLDYMGSRMRGGGQKAAQRIRTMLNKTGEEALDNSPGTLFEIRKAVDGMLATETDPSARVVMMTARKDVDKLLAGSAPGIKDVDARFSELARQKDAVGRGQQVLDDGRTAPRPDELAKEVSDGALPQGEFIGPSAVPVRLREGVRAEIERIVGTKANDRLALQRVIRGEGDWNRDRLATLFGKEKADRIIRVVDAERAYADTSNTVLRNSETARRTAAQDALKPDDPKPGILRSTANFKFGDAMSVPIDAARMAIASTRSASTRNELARVLTSNSPDQVRIAMQAIDRAVARGDMTQAAAKEAVSALLVGNSGNANVQPTMPRVPALLR